MPRVWGLLAVKAGACWRSRLAWPQGVRVARLTVGVTAAGGMLLVVLLLVVVVVVVVLVVVVEVPGDAAAWR